MERLPLTLECFGLGSKREFCKERKDQRESIKHKSQKSFVIT